MRGIQIVHPVWPASRPRPGSALALVMEEYCTMVCGGYSSLLRCCVHPMAMQPREGGQLGLQTTMIRSHLTESELLSGLLGLHPSRIPVHGTLDFSFSDEILHRTFSFAIAFNIAIVIVCLRA